MGFTKSPMVNAAAVKRDLDSLKLKGGSTFIQYTDALLIAISSVQACEKDTVALLNHFQQCGHKASLSNVHFYLPEITYLDYIIPNGLRKLSPERECTIMHMPRPTTKKAMLSFLDMTTYCRQRTFDYRSYGEPLRTYILETAPKYIKWTAELTNCYTKLKEALCTVPALGLQDCRLPFHLYVFERDGIANTVLTQKYGSGRRPVAYYSVSLRRVIKGFPACLHSVAATAVMVERSASIVLVYQCTVCVSHAVVLLLNSAHTNADTEVARGNTHASVTAKENMLQPVLAVPLFAKTRHTKNKNVK
ncbi:hypothetical protein NDU88_009237 [Pleurodeles waltl]|uniref:Reverse transcriptase/retrotransposon-derived protein RNase H-like domain-containing protein n=1 Tax=Pleurodeles waltl TaxID=8319 RepID=A0AAV7PWQ1_PLEWA|nr:hypothetical protein NDU88_009237 [Pleurodeles waltl]